MPEVIVIQPTQLLSPKVKRVAAYARVSSGSEDQLHSYFAQIRYYTELIENMPDAVSAGIYADEGITGTQKNKRTEFLRMVRDCQKGKIDRIITKSVSRFARNTLESLETARLLKDHGVSIYFEEDHLDTAAMSSEALLTLKSAAAQAGSQSISKNTKLGIRMKMKNGTFVNNMVPYGYEYVDRRMVINSTEAEIVRRIYREYLGGYGMQTIALRFNEEQVPCADGAQRWYAAKIRGILTNPKYVGDMIMQRFYQTDVIPYTKTINRGELQWYYRHNTHEAIIERETFAQTQKILNMRRGIYHILPSEHDKPPLWQKLRCNACGHLYQQRVIRDKIYWVCGYHKISQMYCKAKPIPEETLYTAFCNMYNKLKANADDILTPVIEQLMTMQERLRVGNSRIKEIDRRVADLGEQNLLLVKLKSKGYMDEEDYREQKAEIDATLMDLREERALLLREDKEDELLNSLQIVQAQLKSGPSYMEVFDADTFIKLVESITVHQDKLVFRLLSGWQLTETINKEIQMDAE